MIHHLKKRGANIESKTENGWTPLQRTLIIDSSEMTQELLAIGANCSILDINLAIQQNSHKALAVLIAQYPSIFATETLEDDYDTFHYAVYYADLLTVNFLASEWLNAVDLTKCTNERATPIDMARWRRDENAAWSKDCCQPPDVDPT